MSVLSPFAKQIVFGNILWTKKIETKTVKKNIVEEAPLHMYPARQMREDVVVLLSEALTEQTAAFLEKIMGACGRTLSSVRVCVVDRQWQETISLATVVLAFGVKANQIDVLRERQMVDFIEYKQDDTLFLLVPTLVEIQCDVDLKRKLWRVLQKILRPH